MNYKKHYDLLIENSINRNIEGYVEKHHIIPKSLGGSDDKENLVKLSAREHFIAHLLLAKIYGGGMWLAIKLMSCDGKHNNRSYEWVRIKCVKYLSLIGSTKIGELNNFYGKSHSEESLQKIRDKRANQVFSKETIEKFRQRTGEKNSFFGKKHTEETINKLKSRKLTKEQIDANRENGKKLRWVNDGTNIKRIHDIELEKYLSEGWVRGRCDIKPTGRKCVVTEELRNKMREKSSSKRNVHKIEEGILITKRIDVNELDNYLNDGWLRGTGKEKTKEEKIKCGNGSRGRIHSQEEKIKRANSLRKNRNINIQKE